MTAVELVRDLARRGVVLRVDGAVLRARGPAGAVTAELREAIAARRSEVLALLTSHPCVDCGRFAYPAPTRCYWCRQKSTQPPAGDPS